MTFSDYEAYFRTTAQNHKILAHAPGHETFYAIDIEDILKAMKLKTKDMSMLLETYMTRVNDALSDNIRKIQTGAFVIVQEAKMGDVADRNLILNATERVSEDIISKMLNDTRLSRQNKSAFPKINFEPTSLRVQKVGPILTNHYGWRTEFTFNETFTNNLQLDPAKWVNETKFSI